MTVAEKAYAPENPEKGSCFTNFAELYRLEKKFDAAATMYRRGIAILERAWGSEDPRLVGLLDRFAGVLRVQEQYAAAAEVETRATTIRVRQALRGQ